MKIKREKPLSLSDVSPEEIIKTMLETPSIPKEDVKGKKKGRKSKKSKD